MIEYILILALYIIGACFSALQKVADIRKRYPQYGFKTVWNTYLSEEWNTVLVCSLGLILMEITWFIIHMQKIPMPNWVHDYGGIYGIALVAGYCLQRLIYKFLGTTEKAIENKIDNKPTL